MIGANVALGLECLVQRDCVDVDVISVMTEFFFVLPKAVCCIVA